MTKDKQTNGAQTNHALPQGWREVRLGEVIEIFNGKSRPKQTGKYPVYGGNGILGCSDKYNTEGDTIIIGRVGAYCGSVYFEKTKFWLSDNALGVKNKLEISDIKFLYFLLKSINLNKKSIGGAQPLLTQKIIKELKISLPPLPTQKAIAKVLSAFDDKIELLREQNETLEQIGQTLFKEWFGKYSPSRPDDLPEGWRVEDITRVVNVKQGQYIKADLLSDKPTSESKYPVYGANGIRGYYKNYQHTESKVVFGCRGVCGLPKYTEEKFSITNTCMVFDNSDSFLSTEYIYYWSKFVDFESVTSGSAQPQITLSSLSGLKIIIPKKSVLEDFNKVTKPLFDKIKNNNLQIQTLTQIRDTLLPKLMKGEVLV